MPSRWKWAQEQCMVWERGPWDLCASWTVRWLWVIVMKDDAVFTQGSHYEGTWMLLKGYWILLSRWWGDPKLFRLRRNIIRAEIQGLPRWLSGEESACQCGRCQRHIFNPCVKKSPWRRKWQPTPGFFPGKFHGQRSLTGYSPWGRKESDTSKQLSDFTFTVLLTTDFVQISQNVMLVSIICFHALFNILHCI